MTEAEKHQCLEYLAEKAYIAERQGLHHTAKSWRDYALNMSGRRADEMVLARDLGEPVTDESLNRAPVS